MVLCAMQRGELVHDAAANAGVLVLRCLRHLRETIARDAETEKLIQPLPQPAAQRRRGGKPCPPGQVTGKYKVDFEKMKKAVAELVHDIILMQGDGNIALAEKWVNENGKVGEELQKDLDKIGNAGIAKDIVFDQGVDVLGLK